MPRFMHVGHEGFGRADRLLLLAAYPPIFLVDLGVVAVEEGVAAFDRGVMPEGVDELVSGRHRRRVGLRGRRHVGAGLFRRGGLFDLVVEIVLHVIVLTLRRERGARALPPRRRSSLDSIVVALRERRSQR